MEWNQVAETLFYGMGGLIFLWIGISFQEIRQHLKDMTESVVELNSKMAAIVERTEGHERRISRLEDK